MGSYTIEHKDAFRFVGYKTELSGSANIHADGFSPQKTAFFKEVIQSGRMAALQPLSESKYGFGAVVTNGSSTSYYAGVVSSKPALEGTEEVLFPAGEYLVLSGKGGLSRLAFDQLEDQAFRSVLTEDYPYAYNGQPVAEVLLNGNPMDAEVEVWVPVARKNG